jgi:polysaccharide biosynthesis protein PslH
MEGYSVTLARFPGWSWMKILYIAPASPFPINAGARFRVAALHKVLSGLGETKLIVLGETPDLKTRLELKAIGATVLPERRETRWQKLGRYARAVLTNENLHAARFISPKRVARLVRIVDEYAPDLVVLGDSYFAVLIPKLKAHGRRIILDTLNVESKIHRAVLKNSSDWREKFQFLLKARNTEYLEQTMIQLADSLWAVSKSDAEHYSKVLGVKHVHVVPNVIDLSRYENVKALDLGDKCIVFSGWFGYWPNEDAALQLVQLSQRLIQQGNQHRLVLVGREPSSRLLKAAAGQDQILITGEVPDVRPYVLAAAVFAAPLRAGSGTKLKIIEAFALSRAVVTTSFGAEGLNVCNGHEIYIQDDYANFYTTILELLADSRLRIAIGSRARIWVEESGSMQALKMSVTKAILYD